MARLLTCGWETASAYEGTAITSTGYFSLDSTTTRSVLSTYSVKYPSTPAGVAAISYCAPTYATPSISDTWYARFYLNISGAPSTAGLFFCMNGTVTTTWPTVGISLRLNTDRTLSLIYNNTARTPTSAALTADTWYRIEVRGISGSSGQAELVVDGTSVVSVSGASGETVAWAQLGLGSSVATRGCDIYIDDLVLNDSTGSGQNTWPGDSSLKLITATADSAIGTGWTTSGAATTNLYTNIDTIPPLGIADTTANEGKQIRNATSNANTAYDATLQSYSAAGIASADTINVVQAIALTGAPVSTSTKSGTLGCVSNPAGSMGSLSLNAALNPGFFWSGVAAGTFPAGWKSSTGPSVAGDIASGNRGTGPVVRINQVTANTRVAMVTLLGMYVDYTPGIPAASLVWKTSRGANYRR